MSTPEELAAQEAAQKEAAAKAEAEAKADLESIPESLRGKSPKELVELLLNTSTEAEKLKGALSARESEIEQLKPKPSFDQLSDTEKKTLREKDFVNDPLAYLDKHYEERMRPLTEEYFRGQAEVQLTLVKSDKERYPNFNALEKEVRGYLDKMPVDVRANPQAIDWAYKMAEYPLLQKMLKEGNVRGGLYVEGGGSPPPEPQKKAILDDDEKTVAKRFGMTDEEYIKYSGKGTVDDFS